MSRLSVLLAGMAAEIATLEGKFPRARQLQRGLMQELLLGRLRLV